MFRSFRTCSVYGRASKYESPKYRFVFESFVSKKFRHKFLPAPFSVTGNVFRWTPSKPRYLKRNHPVTIATSRGYILGGSEDIPRANRGHKSPERDGAPRPLRLPIATAEIMPRSFDRSAHPGPINTNPVQRDSAPSAKTVARETRGKPFVSPADGRKY